jgi:hypothetical protein
VDAAVPAKLPGIVRVLEGIKPAFVTNKATVIEFYDRLGGLMALFFKHFEEDMWVFSTKSDPDWESNLVRLGYLDPKAPIEVLAGAQGIKA